MFRLFGCKKMLGIVEGLLRRAASPSMPPRHASRLETARTSSTGRMIAGAATCNGCLTGHKDP